MMKKIIYIMNVDWNWIKQRPHYLAEGLTKYGNLLIIYQYRYGRWKLQKRKKNNLNIKPIYTIPKIGGINSLKWINEIILRISIKKIIKHSNSQAVFTTYPNQIDMIPSNYKGDIFYDCMDNHIEFIKDKKNKEILMNQEKRLVFRAKKIFVSSEYLLNNLIDKYNVSKTKIELIRNAYNGKIQYNFCDSKKETRITLAYIGTISVWFDWQTIIDVLKKKKNVEVHLFGPVDKTIIPYNEKIIYHGVVEHSDLYGAIKDMDVLIMPFVVNEIIKAVDPVKVYEYINFNKNIIIRKYDEVERLSNFVYYYSNVDEFINAINQIEINRTTKYNNSERIKFLKDNTWNKRVERMREIMEL